MVDTGGAEHDYGIAELVNDVHYPAPTKVNHLGFGYDATVTMESNLRLFTAGYLELLRRTSSHLTQPKQSIRHDYQIWNAPYTVDIEDDDWFLDTKFSFGDREPGLFRIYSYCLCVFIVYNMFVRLSSNR